MIKGPTYVFEPDGFGTADIGKETITRNPIRLPQPSEPLKDADLQEAIDSINSIFIPEWDNKTMSHRQALVYISPSENIKITYGNIYDCVTAAPELPTEELAELHAIIQAIEFERVKG